jgi:hypothetical protein
MHTSFRLSAVMLALAMAGMGTATAATQTPPLTREVTATDRVTNTENSSMAASKFAADFATFTGSQQNAMALITGLRNGTPIVLTDATTGAGTATTGTTSGTPTGSTQTTIVPPTKSMGYGSAYTALRLAQAQLAQYGITCPTPDQLEAALTGGTVTIAASGGAGTTATSQTLSLTGVLNQRASGMGWGQIAQSLGVKPGPIVSGMKSATTHLAHDATHGTGTKGASSRRRQEVDGHDQTEHSRHRATATGARQGDHDSGPKSTSAAAAGRANRASNGTGHKASQSGTTRVGGGATTGSTRGDDDLSQEWHSNITTAAGAGGESYRHEHEYRSRVYGAGIVTAAGGSNVVLSHAAEYGHEQGTGVVTATGARVASNGVTSAGSAGKGGAGRRGKDD